MILDALTVGPASPPVKRLADSSRSLVCELILVRNRERGRLVETETEGGREKIECIVGR